MSLPPYGRDTPIHVVMNAGSGHTDAAAARAAMTRVFEAAGRRHRFHTIEAGGSVAEAAAAAVRAARVEQGAVVAAGGDGTLNGVAQAVLGSGCAFGVVPRGTFNYFARTHGIPSDTEAAARALLGATVQPTQIGLVNDRVFLVNASLGLYPRVLEARETHKRRFGRSRLVAFGSAFATMLGAHRPLHLVIRHDGVERRVRAETLFIANNALQLEQIGVDDVEAVDQLVAISLQPVRPLVRIRLMLHGAFGQLKLAREVESIGFRTLQVEAVGRRRRARPMVVATDGEIVPMSGPLVFRISPEPLLLLRPSGDDAVPRA